MYRKTRKNKSNKRRSKRRSYRSKKMRGGSAGMSRIMGMPSMFGMPSGVGMPYNAADLTPKGNYYAYNPNVEQWPDQSNSMIGGRGRKTKYAKTKYAKTKYAKKGKTKYAKTKYAKKGKTKYGKTKYGKTKYGKKGQRGGGITEFVTTLLPEEIVSIGRSLPAGLGHMYDRFNGSTPSASSMVYPTDQPLVQKTSTDIGTPPSDIVKIYNQKNNLVSGI
jgi:hypothetical protein